MKEGGQKEDRTERKVEGKRQEVDRRSGTEQEDVEGETVIILKGIRLE